jgi:hypothetical protein
LGTKVSGILQRGRERKESEGKKEGRRDEKKEGGGRDDGK